MELSPQAQEVLTLIEDTLEDRGYEPAVTDIAKELNIHRNKANDAIKELQEHGHIVNCKRSPSYMLK